MASVAFPAQPSQTVAAPLAAPLALLFATLLAFTLIGQATDAVAAQAPAQVWLWAGGLTVIVVLLACLEAPLVPRRRPWPKSRNDGLLDPWAPAFAGERAGSEVEAWALAMPAFLRVFLRGGSLFLILYLIVEPFAVPYAALGDDHPAARFHFAARYLALVLAIGGLFRPSLIFGAAMLLWMIRELQGPLTGFYFSTLDIRNVAEAIAVVALGCALLGAAQRCAPRALGLEAAAVERAALLLIGVAIGAHMANYLWSGIAKLALDGGAFSWLLGNRLSDGIPAAIEKGTLPFAASPWLTQAAHDAFQAFALPINAASLAIQLFALAAVANRRWLIAITLIYDLFHIVVYLALGLLFWKWIALNMIIVATLLSVSDEQWRRARAAAMIATLAGAAIFKVGTLAWYESPGFASPYFVARLDDGRSLRVPHAWFLSSSYQVSQGRLWWPGDQRHFNSSIWGSVLSYKDLQAGRACRPPERAQPAPEQWGPPAALARYVRAQHAIMVKRAPGDWLLPHHHVPSALIDYPFAAVRSEQVVRYDYVLDSVCLRIEQGRLVRDVMARTVLPVYAPGSDRMLP